MKITIHKDIVHKTLKQSWSLKELVRMIRPEQLHCETTWGGACGKEYGSILSKSYDQRR